MPIFPTPARRLSRQIGIPVAILGLAALVLFTALQFRAATHRHAEDTAGSLLRTLTDSLATLSATLDESLRAAGENPRIAGFDTLPRASQQRIVFERAGTIEGLSAMLVLDARGDIEFDSIGSEPRASNFSDRPYFQHHRDAVGDHLFVSGPLIGRAGLTEPFIAFSRRRDDGDGRFAGVVVGAIRLNYLRTLFERSQLGPSTTITLYDGRGVVLMHVPYEARFIGQPLLSTAMVPNSGATELPAEVAVSALDGVERLFAVSGIPGTPLQIRVGLAMSAVRQGWVPQALLSSALGAACIGLLLWSRHRIDHEHRQRLLAEGQFRILAEHSPDIITRTDRDGRRVYVSPSATAILGYHPDELIGSEAEHAYHAADAGGVTSQIAAMRQGATRHTTVSVRAYRHDGKMLRFESTMAAIITDGEYDGFVAIDRDVTRRVEEEEASRRLAIEIERFGQKANLAALSGGLAHELQQPLAAAANFAGALKRTVEAEPGKLTTGAENVVVQATAGISRSIDRAAHIVRTIRGMASQHPQRLERVGVEALIAGGIRLARSSSLFDRVRIEARIPPNVDDVLADEIQILQVIYNLVRNAAEACVATNDPLVTIAACEMPWGEVELSVIDNGPGVPRAVMPRLFDAFNTSKDMGMGIGLAICRTIVEAHGGRISLASTSPSGATFRFTLPRVGRTQAA